METLLIVVGVAILIALIVALIAKGNWKTIATARGEQADDLERKSAYLKQHGLHSRVRSDNSAPAASGFAAAPGMGTQGPSNHAIYRLEVKSKEQAQAEQLLEKLEKEQLIDQGLTI